MFGLDPDAALQILRNGLLQEVLLHCVIRLLFHILKTSIQQQRVPPPIITPQIAGNTWNLPDGRGMDMFIPLQTSVLQTAIIYTLQIPQDVVCWFRRLPLTLCTVLTGFVLWPVQEVLIILLTWERSPILMILPHSQL